MKTFLFLVVLIAGAATFFFIKGSYKEDPIIPEIIKVERGTIVHTIESPGYVEALDEVEISAQVVGQIDKLYVKKGQKVQKGDNLVQLDYEDYEAKVQSAQAKIDQLKSTLSMVSHDLEKSKTDLARGEQLSKSFAITRSELDEIRTINSKDQDRLEMTKSQLDEAKAILRQVQSDLERTKITSPIKGTVSMIFAEEGETVVVGTMNNPGTVILVVSDIDEMVVRARIDETDIPFVKLGQEVKIHFQYDEDVELSGEVIEISPKGFFKQNEEVSFFETLVSVNDPVPQVKLGMSAHVQIAVEKKSDIVIVPLQVVFSCREGKKYQYYVFVLGPHGIEPRNIATGISDDNSVEVVEGLNPGDRVVAGPRKLLIDLKQRHR